eukprot:tig00020537_g10259.t1
MATLLLADLSESMNEPVLGEDSTRAELAQRGLLHFLQSSALQQEPVALMTFASDTEVAVPFSRDLRTTKAKLFDLTVVAAERRFERSLAEAAAYAASAWGSDVAVQVVVITDSPAAPGVDETLAGLAGADARLHFVVLAPEPRALDARGYAEVAQRSGAAGRTWWTSRGRGAPAASPAASSSSPSTPSPGPSTPLPRRAPLRRPRSRRLPLPRPSRSFPRAAVAELVGSLEAPTELPRRLRVAGFVPAAEAALCPCVSRHLLGEAAGAPPRRSPRCCSRTCGPSAWPASSPSTRPAPRAGPRLVPAPPRSPRPALTLLQRSGGRAAARAAAGLVAGARPRHDARRRAAPSGPAPPSPTTPTSSPLGAPPGARARPLPLPPRIPAPGAPGGGAPAAAGAGAAGAELRGQRGYTYPSAAAEAVAADVGKVLRLARGLPGKRDALLQELKRLRETALAFCFPALLAETARLLADEAAALEGAGNRDGAKVAREHAESLANSVVSGALRPSAPAPPAP